MALNLEQIAVLDSIHEGRNVFVTGSAGVGKSYLIDSICKELDKKQKEWRLLAPTGVAAVNIGGVTIHKFACIPPEITTAEDFFDMPKFRPTKQWRSVDALIIDEISMVHPKLFKMLHDIAKRVRGSNEPMGGIQMILVGDLFQLPYVPNKDDNGIEYIFETEIWNDLDLKIHNLKTIMRQSDKLFIDGLNSLRVGKLNKSLKKVLRESIMNEGEADKHYIRLVSLNIQKDMDNERRLRLLHAPMQSYKSKDFGDERSLVHCRMVPQLVLKVGCPVMLLRNMPDHDLCNGSIGTVVSFDSTNMPLVKFNAGPTLRIERHKWEYNVKKSRGQYELMASRTQLPLVVAYSISIHKSQSLTMDYVEVDLSGVFCAGQMYVALSRARTLKGLKVKNFSERHLMVDPKIVAFYESLENE